MDNGTAKANAYNTYIASHSGKSGPALAGTEYRLIAYAFRLVV